MGKRNINIQVEARPVPGHQPVVMEQKEKAEMVLLESEKEAACQDPAPAHPTPQKRKNPSPVRHLGAAERAALKRRC